MSAQWYLYKDGRQQGPFSLGDLYRQAEAGLFGPADLVWTGGMENWGRADQVKGLISALSPASSGRRSTPQPGAPHSYQQQGSGSHRAAPAPGRGKGVLIVLIVVLVVVLLGGGYFAFNLLLPGAASEIANGSDPEIRAEDTGREQVTGDQNEVYVPGLWAQPLIPAFMYCSEFIEDCNEAGVDAEVVKETHLTQLIERLPKENEVPHPLYPGALAQGANPRMPNEELQGIYLLTTDSMDSVLNFYKNHLSDWQSEDLHDGGFIFWKGDPEGYTAARAMSIDSIIIREPDALELNYMPNANTYISIIYSPN